MDEMSFESNLKNVHAAWSAPITTTHPNLLISVFLHQVIDLNFVPQTTFSLAGNMNGKISA